MFERKGKQCYVKYILKCLSYQRKIRNEEDSLFKIKIIQLFLSDYVLKLTFLNFPSKVRFIIAEC